MAKLPPLGRHPMTTPAGNRFAYIADPTDMLARSIVWDDLTSWESGSLREFSRLVQSSELFLDVGAYTGIYSLIACTDGPGRAIALEPNPRIFPLLQRNVAANDLGGRIETLSVAASDRGGTSSLAVPEDTTAAHLSEDAGGPTVETVTLDSLLGERRVDLIKLDLEGHEPAALDGAAGLLGRDRPALIVECLSSEAFSAVEAAVRRHGYDRCRHLGPDGPRDTASKIDLPRHANYLWTAEPVE